MNKPDLRAIVPDLPLWTAVVTLLMLICLLGLAVYLFGDEATAGPNQFAIACCAGFAGILARLYGHGWDEIREAVKSGVAVAIPALFILLAVGALIGTWSMSGTIVAMVYYGLEIINLDFFYVSVCIISMLVSLSIGSSWTVAGTLGVGFMGMAHGVGLSPAITAGAVISGAYVGDKASPLSDATNLAAAVAESEVFKHIRYTLITTIPALAIAIVGFLIFDINERATVSQDQVDAIQGVFSNHFTLSLWALTPLLVVLVFVIRGIPPFLSIMAGALAGGIVAVILQPVVVLTYAGELDVPSWLAMMESVWRTLSNGFVIDTGVVEIDALLSRGGMESMLGTVWLILTALAFGAIIEKTGMIYALLQPLIAFAKTTGRLFIAVVTTCFGINVLAADQYIAISLPGRVFAAEFKQRGLAPENLSRVIGDSATVTSALVPWNTCGAYMAATLGVGTLSYLPYCFFNLANPIISIAVGVFGIGIAKVAATSPLEKPEAS